MSAFNPYREWLGIQAKGSVTYYQLLGVKRQDSASVIRKRATRVIRRLQKVDPGEYANERDRLINRVRRAAMCLSDTTERKKYDRRLEQQREKQTAAKSRASQRPQPAPGRKHSSNRVLANEPAKTEKATTKRPAGREDSTSRSKKPPRGREESRSSVPKQPSPSKPAAKSNPGSDATARTVTDELMRLRPRRSNIAPAYKANRRRSRSMAVSLALFAISLLGIGFLVLQQTGWGHKLLSSSDSLGTSTPASSQSPPSQSTVAQTSKRSLKALDNQPSQASGTADTSPRQNPTREDAIDPGGTNASLNSTTNLGVANGEATERSRIGTSAASSSDRNAELLTILREAKQLLGQREIANARERIAAARPLTADSLDQAMLERLSTVAGYVQTYWQATESQLASFQSGNEAMIDGRQVMVVEKTDRRLIIRAAGKNQTIDLQKITTKQAAKLADAWLDETADSTKVFRGAMMAVTPGYDKEEARRLWHEAEAGGEIHLGDLEQVLDDKYE